jgi:hypothetical protein
MFDGAGFCSDLVELAVAENEGAPSLDGRNGELNAKR